MTQAGIISEAGYLLITRLALPAASFFLLIYIGKQSDTLLGEYALVTTFYFVMQTLPLLGLTPYVLREAARHPARAGALYGTVGTLSLVACASIVAIAYFVLPATPYRPDVQLAIVAISYAIIPGILAFLAELLLISLHHARWVAYTALLENIARVLASVVVLLNGGTVESLMWVLLVTRGSALISYAVALRLLPATPVTPRFDVALLREIKGLLPVFFAVTVLALVISRLDYIVLSLYQHVEQIGYYAIAYRLLEIAQMAVIAVLTSLYPRLAALYTSHPRQFRTAAHFAFRIALAILALAAFLGVLWADRYVGWLFARQYPHPVLLTEAFILLIVIVGLDNFMSGLLNASDSQEHDLSAQACGGLSYAMLLFACVPQYGNWGALVAFAFAVMIQLCARITLYRRNVGPLHWGRDLVKLGAVSLLILLPLGWLLHGAPVLWLTLGSMAAALAYIIMLTFLGFFELAKTLLIVWPRRLGAVRSDATLAGLCDHLVLDLARWRMWRGRAGRSAPTASRIHNHSPLAVVLYRWSRLCYLNGRTRIARLLAQFNLFVTKAELQPAAAAGPGLLLTHTVGTILVGKVGSNLTLGAWAAIGRRGHADIGGGAGMPVVGDAVVIGHRAGLQGPIRCPSHHTFPPHLSAVYAHHLRAIKPNLGTPVEVVAA